MHSFRLLRGCRKFTDDVSARSRAAKRLPRCLSLRPSVTRPLAPKTSATMPCGVMARRHAQRGRSSTAFDRFLDSPLYTRSTVAEANLTQIEQQVQVLSNQIRILQ